MDFEVQGTVFEIEEELFDAGEVSFDIEEVFEESREGNPPAASGNSAGENPGMAASETGGEMGLQNAVEIIRQERPVFEELGISFGSPFIPKELYEEFVMELLHVKTRLPFHYSEAADRWSIETSMEADYSVYNRYEYGTPRMDAVKIMEHGMNNQPPKVQKKAGREYVTDFEETARAQEKLNLIEAKFATWLGANGQRKQQVCEHYYELFGRNTRKRYHGSKLELPDLNPEVVLYPHQRDAVARIILEKDVLLNHAVGSGKTYEMIVGLHERKRRGISEKNLVVVPNQVLHAFVDAHRYLYPKDVILVVAPKDFTPAKRTAMLERIRTEDTVAVYMAYSSFAMIPMSLQYRISQIEGQIRDANVAAASAAIGKERREERQYRRLAARLEEKCIRLLEEPEEDEGAAFDCLGITTLAVDEAHNFKNITISTRMDGIVGMHTKGGKSSDDMLAKVQYVRRQGGGVIFATGTPLTNSISDIYTLQQYLQPEQLKFLQIDSFDKWVQTFAQKRTEVEVDVTGQSFTLQTRFSQFYNLPELVSIFDDICDTYCGENSGLGLPECGARIDTVLTKSPEQQDYLELLNMRSDMIRDKLVHPEEDNYLKITKDGRRMALDVRLTEPEAKPEEGSIKVCACAKNLYECYLAHPGTAQLVFCDISTPGKAFNIYDELKRILIEMGIPGQEIAFVHDAETENARRKLFADVNEAKVRVLIGSTAKMGTGVNVQNRLIAIHHLDVPWRPADITQREGRLIRQGNSNPEVYIYRYITEGTFDAYSWQILENKKRFIDQFVETSLQNRSAEDVADAVLGYAEIKALAMGNPLLKTRVELAGRLERVKRSRRQRTEDIRELRGYLAQAPAKAKKLSACQRGAEKDQRTYEREHTAISREARAAFGDSLLGALHRHVQAETEQPFDTLFGFQILLPANMEEEKPYILLCGPGKNRYPVDMKNAKAGGCIQRIEYFLSQLDRVIWQVKGQIHKEQTRMSEARKILEEGNPYEEEVKNLESQLMKVDRELEEEAGNNF